MKRIFDYNIYIKILYLNDELYYNHSKIYKFLK